MKQSTPSQAMPASTLHATSGRAFFHPGGFARLDAQPLGEGARLRWLVAVFARAQLRSLTAKLTAASVPASALVGAAILALLTRIPQLMELVGDDPAVFITDKAMPILFGVNLLTVLLQATVWIAPAVAADVQAGALLLYFSRPMRRRDYLYARVAASAAVIGGELALAGLLMTVVLVASFGLQVYPGTDAGPLRAVLFWLALALGELLVSALAGLAIALCALGASAVARSVNGAQLLFAGVLLGSIPLALVAGNVMGAAPAWEALNLVQGLNALHTLWLSLLSPQPMAEGLAWKALTALGLWSALAAVAWQALVRLLRNPPAGKGRA